MRVLLDTHTFLWWDLLPDNLSPRVRAICADPNNTLVLSVASVWEITIKLQAGKLQLASPLESIIADQQKINGFELLSISLEHIYAIETLPIIHKDPFDRVLIAQAQHENMPILSRDSVFQRYPVVVEW